MIAGVFVLLSGHMASLFSEDERVLAVLTQYLCIVPIGYGMMEIHRYIGFSFNSVGMPFRSVTINALRVLVLLVPLSILGASWFGLRGLFWGRVCADIASASLALCVAQATFGRLKARTPRTN